MCSKMVQFSAPSPEEPKKEISDADKKAMETIRKEFEKQFTYVHPPTHPHTHTHTNRCTHTQTGTHTHTHRVMKNKESMSQMVLPRTLPPEQEECAKEVAHGLGLKTEKVQYCCSSKSSYNVLTTSALGFWEWTPHLQGGGTSRHVQPVTFELINMNPLTINFFF